MENLHAIVLRYWYGEGIVHKQISHANLPAHTMTFGLLKFMHNIGTLTSDPRLMLLGIELENGGPADMLVASFMLPTCSPHAPVTRVLKIHAAMAVLCSLRI